MSLAALRSSLRRMFESPVAPSVPLDLARVLEEEERHLSEPGESSPLDGSAAHRLTTMIAHRHRTGRTALCLSGGGIRSAAFAIGVMQGLAALGLLTDFDYVSTVSGGGYAGGWLSAWLCHDADTGEHHQCNRMSVSDQLAGACRDALGAEPEPLRYVREFSRYLDPRIGLLSVDIWTLVATVCRNLLANWLVLLPMIAAALLVPRIYFAFLALGAQRATAMLAPLGAVTWLLLIATTACAIVALRFVVCNLPSGRRGCSSQKQFIIGCLAPVVTAAGLLTLYWAWDYELTGTTTSALELLLGIVAAHIGVWLAWGKGTGRRPRTWFGAAVAAAVTAGGLWLIEQRVFPDPLAWPELYTTTAVPLVLLAIGIAGGLFVAIAAGETEDDDFEWWSRAGAWLLIVSGVWLAAASLVFFGPRVMHAVAVQLTRLNLTLSQAKLLLGGLTLSSGGAAARALGPGAGRKPSAIRHVVFALAAPTFVVCLLMVLSWANLSALDLLHALSPSPYPHPPGAGLDEIAKLLIGLLATGLVMSYFVNVNNFSLHGMYRARLIRTFLGASRSHMNRKPNPFTGFDPADNLTMSDLRQIQRPLHVINVALNVVSTTRLAWQDRQAESFTISPLHSGSQCVGYRPSDVYGQKISLGTAMTLSGAAVSPNQGSQSSPALTFLLTLFNARLGAWLGNPGKAGAHTWHLRDPRLGPAPLLNELFGRTTDSSPYVYLSDGGHFDNLGVYEMVLRRCQYIVVSDAGCDPQYTFEDLGNAIRKIRIDFGIPITFTRELQMTSEGQGKTNRHCAVATIDYRSVDGGDAQQGMLVYIKATLSGGEPIDIGSYSRASTAFPHEATTDQWFDEAQFESYRALGVHTMDEIAREVKTLDNAPPTIRDLYLAAERHAAGRDAAATDADVATT